MKKEITYNKVEETGCWECTSHRTDEDGYARIKIKGKHALLHRKFYELYHGVIPEGLVIRHKCNNPICINPNHLIAGTQFDNMQDAIKAGTHVMYEKLIRNRISTELADEIRRKYTPQTYSHARLAREYGISRTTIQRIVKNELSLTIKPTLEVRAVF